jgi:hypothetical protein
VACFNVSVLADGVALSGWGVQTLPLVSLPTAQQAFDVLYQVTVMAVSPSGVSGPMANVSWTLTDTRVGEPDFKLSISTHQTETVLTWAWAGASSLTYAIDGGAWTIITDSTVLLPHATAGQSHTLAVLGATAVASWTEYDQHVGVPSFVHVPNNSTTASYYVSVGLASTAALQLFECSFNNEAFTLCASCHLWS